MFSRFAHDKDSTEAEDVALANAYVFKGSLRENNFEVPSSWTI